MTPDQARTLIGERFGAAQIAEQPEDQVGPLTVTLPVDAWLPFAQFAKDELRCRYFSFLTAVDWKDEGLDVVIKIDNVDDALSLIVKTRLEPGVSSCPSLTPLYRGANWMEREAHEMFGIAFEGHPDLRNLLLTDDWEGHPLLKSYAVDTAHPPYR